MESPINEVLTNFNKNKKLPTKPPNNREKYYQLYEWSRASLQKIERLMQNSAQGASSEFLGEQKKIILSMLLQMSRLTKQQCVQKGQLVEQMFRLAVKFINEHQKSYDMLTYRQVKNFWNSTAEMQKQYQKINQQLRKQIKVLTDDKEHRWRNLFMLIKDNRIFRRRNSKLLKAHKQLAWKIKQLEQDLISLRSQNQKYRLQLEAYPNKQNSLKSYVINQLLLNKLDERVKLFPGRARRLLKKQLIDLDINELNTLSEKIKFIVQSMEQNGQVCQQFDAWDDNIETTRHFYNVSVQTYIETQTTGVNTIQLIAQKKAYQPMKVQARPRDFSFLQLISKTIEVKFESNIKKCYQRKKTEQKYFVNLSNNRLKRQVSTYNKEAAHNNSHKKEYKLKIQNTVNLNLRGPVAKKKKVFTLSNQQQKQPKPMQATVAAKSKAALKEVQLNENRKSRRSTLFSIRRKQYMPTKTKWDQLDVEKQRETLGENIFNFTSSQNFISQTKMLGYQFKIYQLEYKSKNEAIRFTQQKFDSKREKLKQKQEISMKMNQKKANQNQEWRMPAKTIRKEEQLRNKENELDNNFIKNINKVNIKVSKTDNLKYTENNYKHNERMKTGNRQISHRRQNTQNLERMRSGPQQKYELKKNHKQQQFFRSTLQLRPLNHELELNKKNKNLLPFKQIQQEYDGYQKLNNDACVQSPQNRQMINGQKILQKIFKTIFDKRKEIIGHPQTLRYFLESILPSIIRFKQDNGLRKASNSQNNKVLYKLFKSIKELDVKKQSENLMYASLLLQKLMPIKKCQLFSADMFLLFAIMLEKLTTLGALNCFSNIYYVQAEYGLKVIEYLCSIYLSDQQAELFISTITVKQNRINMIDAFINIVNELEFIVFESELWSFFSNFPFYENECLSESDIVEMASIFNFVSVSGWSHIQRLSYYIGTGLPLHRLCLFAHRFGWNEMKNIKTWLDKKYVQHFGIFWHDAKQIGNIYTRIQQKMSGKEKKYKFIYRILTQMHFKFKHYRIPLNQKFLKMCNLINSFDQIESFEIFSPNLQYIHEAYRSLLVKQQKIC